VLTFIQDPQAKLDYAVDWRQWLADDEIESFVITATPDMEVAAVPTPMVNTGILVFWLQGGSVDNDYMVTCHIVTVGGRTDERTFRVKVKTL